jgi:hypothetical protein
MIVQLLNTAGAQPFDWNLPIKTQIEIFGNLSNHAGLVKE